MKPILITGVLFACTLFASAQHPRFVAHRGASHKAPENTIAAFKLAWEENADGIEGDFYLSKDGEVVCFHDKDLKRVAGREGKIEEMSWSELSTLDVGSWKSPDYKGEKIPRLADVLDLLKPGKLFYLEIKDGPEIVAPIGKILAEKKADPEQVIFIAFDAEVVKECRRQLPQFRAHWLSSLKGADEPGKAEAYVKELGSTGAQGFQFDWRAPVGAEWVKALKDRKYTITSWTVNDADAARRMIRYGVDFITTDRPAGLRAELKDPEKLWNVRDHIKREDFMIQSHRGAGELGPENSKEAFGLAWSLGTIPEADIRTTKDGVIVAFHDKDFHRILPHETEEVRKKGIEHLTWKEVAALDIGVWKGEKFKGQRVSSFADIVSQLKEDPRRKIYVDIKNVDLKQLADEADKGGVTSRLILASTKPDVIRGWKAVAPKSFTLHWMGGDEAALAARLDKLEAEHFKGVDQLQIHVRRKDGVLTPSVDFLKETGRRLRARGILFQTLPWEMKDAETYQQLMDLGCASFATDFPDAVSKTVTDYYAGSR
ncbi:glycerophosphodiester phosphodiesterase family protein [Luteolibacter sp. SL250]|uniref:glycerophosphodiester phosphodiesterase family protein n=1 Tax=Luteolibacter sp. SL250 TaxID=2995170 RepID=UPI00226DF89D|nr:glycerophosphodiester phosphodiesterase family protein [Luteolibacter sp. SL250]WAC21368.1 glycerophosphodiester phosphodiesterase family protein [Luteolibacter sp. SL250]